MVVKIQVRKVGVNFGVCAVIRDMKNHELFETRVCPNGFDGAAINAALDVVDLRGWVLEDES